MKASETVQQPTSARCATVALDIFRALRFRVRRFAGIYSTGQIGRSRTIKPRFQIMFPAEHHLEKVPIKTQVVWATLE